MADEELKGIGNDVDTAGNFVGPNQPIMNTESNGMPETQPAIEHNETPITRVEILDTSGRVLCGIDQNIETGRITAIYPKPYQNIEGLAENVDERICVTDQEGNITNERLTRGEAREAKRRYLIVTTLIFHDNKILVQQRSEQKRLIPAKNQARRTV